MVQWLQKTQGPKSISKRRTFTHCLARRSCNGLVHVRRREKKDRKIVGISMGPFVSCDRIQKEIKKMGLYCHRKIKSITCVCIYVGTYHACDQVINRTITICPCPDSFKVCQEEVDKREYYDCRWQKNEDGYTVCGMCMEKLGCRTICEACFCTRCEKEKKGY